ncbi:unnamed protein product [Prunus armeniaca]
MVRLFSDVLPAIPVTLSDEHASQIELTPQPTSDVFTPILTDHQHEVGEPIMPDPSSVRVCIARALVENGGKGPPSANQDYLIQSLLDHAPCDIFPYLDQWDASTTTAEASTRHATSSTMARVLLDPVAEAILWSYTDRDCISLADQDETDRVKAVIEALERRAVILAKVSEDIWRYRLLEAQLCQDSVALKSFKVQKLPIIFALSVGEKPVLGCLDLY